MAHYLEMKAKIPALIIFTLCMASCLSILSAQCPEHPEEVLAKRFGEDRIVVCRKPPTVKFCPDNTCEVFSTDREEDMQKLLDFVYLYLSYVSNYTVLEQIRNTPDSIEVIVKRSAIKNCSPPDPSCIRAELKMLGREIGVRLKFVRHDEGEWNEVPEDLDEILEHPK